MLVAGTSSAWGADKTFNATNGNWNVASNWSPKGIPSNADHVIIPMGSTATVTGNVQCAQLKVQEGGKLVISGNVEILVSRNNNGDKSDYIVIDGTLSFENGATLEAKSNGGSSKDKTVIQANGVITGEGAFIGTNFVLSPDADYSGFTPADGCSDDFKKAYDNVINTITSTPVYLFGNNTPTTISQGQLFSSGNTIAYKDANKRERYASRIYFNKQTIYVQEGQFTLDCEPTITFKNLNISGSCIVNVATGKGSFNGSGTLTITAELSVSNSGETNTFASEASGTIFTSGTVRVTNPNWGGVAPRFYIGTNSNWTADKNWSIDANRNIYYWNNNAYYYPGKNANNDVAHIAAGKSVTLSTSIANPIGITAYGTVTLNGDISLGSSNKLIAYPGSNVTVNSSITRTNADQIIVYHTYANSASFYKGSNGRIGDNQLNVRHKIKGGRVYYMGASTEGGSYSMPAGTSEYYDAATEEFTSGNPTSGTHRTGTVKLSAAGTISETGSVPFSDKTYTLKKAEGKFGWNLLCNPFTTGVSLSSLTAEDGAVEPTVWVRVKDGSSYGFVTYSISTGVSSPAGAGSEIAPQQAFFVKAKNDGVSFKVKYPSSGTSGATLKSATIAPDDVLRLTISSEGENADEVAMVFRNGGSLDRTYGDAEKRCENATYNALFALKDDVRCVIPFYPEARTIEGEELPLGFRISSKSTKATITATNLDEFGVANDIYLIDKQENIITNLTEEMSYEFSAQAGIEIFERFAIVLGYVKDNEKENDNNDIATGIEAVEEEMQTALVYGTEGLIVNCTNTDNAVLRVYDSVGRLVICETISASRTVVQIANNGLYIAELTAPNGSTRTKILVK